LRTAPLLRAISTQYAVFTPRAERPNLRDRRDLRGYSRLSDNDFMCRNIKTLFNFDPPATDEEIRAASLQFVRKLSGFNAPSRANDAAFNAAIEEVSPLM
jgi:hypothetical protein